MGRKRGRWTRKGGFNPRVGVRTKARCNSEPSSWSLTEWSGMAIEGAREDILGRRIARGTKLEARGPAK